MSEHELGVSEAEIAAYRQALRVDRGDAPGLTAAEMADLLGVSRKTARRRAEAAVEAGRMTKDRKRLPTGHMADTYQVIEDAGQEKLPSSES